MFNYIIIGGGYIYLISFSTATAEYLFKFGYREYFINIFNMRVLIVYRINICLRTRPRHK